MQNNRASLHNNAGAQVPVGPGCLSLRKYKPTTKKQKNISLFDLIFGNDRYRQRSYAARQFTGTINTVSQKLTTFQK